MAEYKKKLLFSKSFTTTLNIAPGSKAAERFLSQAEINEHAPFDTIIASNAGNTAIAIHLDRNEDNAIPISPSGSVAAEDQNFGDFTIQNTGSTNVLTAGQFRILVQKFAWVPIK